MTFNRSRGLFHCEPNCPRRKPGCQDHCETHQGDKARHEARKKEYYGDTQLKQYLAEKNAKARDIYAKHKKESKSSKWYRD